MEAVFSIPELFEAILLNLDMIELLLLAPRVCRRWHDVIGQSPAIQQALYFSPVPAKSPSRSGESDGDDAAAIKPVLNPLLVKQFAPCFFDFGSKAYFRRANAFYSMPWTVRPRREVPTGGGVIESLPSYPQLDPPGPNDQADRRRFTRSGASWRRMLVSQPPPVQVGCLWSEELRDTRPWRTPFWHTKVPLNVDPLVAGLRMGELYDLVQYRASTHQRCSLWFRIYWNQVREPFYCDFSENAGRQIIRDTNVMIEFHEADDAGATHVRDPTDPDAFNAVFRCDQHCPLEVEFTSHIPAAVVELDWLDGPHTMSIMDGVF